MTYGTQQDMGVGEQVIKVCCSTNEARLLNMHSWVTTRVT